MTTPRIFGSRTRKTGHFAGSASSGDNQSVLRRLVTTITACALVAVTSACGVRLEVAPPSELEPTRDEIARQAVVLELDTVQRFSDAAMANQSTELVKTLETISEGSALRASKFGGTYVSGLPADVSSPSDSDTSEPIENVSPDEVSVQLLESAQRLRSTMNMPQDPQLARLLASIAIAHVGYARDISFQAGTPFTLPAAFDETPLATSTISLDQETLNSLIMLEDRAGYLFEVIAAMQEKDSRDFARNSASSHRLIAQRLAELNQVSGTDSDPRVATYPVPLQLDAETPIATAESLYALAQQLESELVSNYLVALTQVEPEERASIADLAVSRSVFAAHWGVNTQLFPFISDEVAVTYAAP